MKKSRKNDENEKFIRKEPDEREKPTPEQNLEELYHWNSPEKRQSSSKSSSEGSCAQKSIVWKKFEREELEIESDWNHPSSSKRFNSPEVVVGNRRKSPELRQFTSNQLPIRGVPRLELDPEKIYYFQRNYGVTLNLDARLGRTLRSIREYVNEHSKEFEIFNKQLIIYYKLNKQTDDSRRRKFAIRDQLSVMIHDIFPHGYLAVGGSTVNGCGSNSSDLDLCFGIKPREHIFDKNGNEWGKLISLDYLDNIKFVDYAIETIYDHFENNYKDEFSLIDPVLSARVPVIKLKLKSHRDIEVDININCTAGIYNSHLLHYYSRIDERLPILAAFLKKYLDERCVIQPRHGRLNSYTVVLMIIHYLQCCVDPPILPNLNFLYPAMFDGTTDIENLKFDQEFPTPLKDIPKNDMTVGELLLGFFDYYANFDYAYDAISMMNGMVFSRDNLGHGNHRFLFYIEEVYDGLTVPKNLTDANDLQDIIRIFKDSRNRVLELNYTPTIDLFLQSLKKADLDRINDEISGENVIIAI
uniref:PAP-associated domain-containing protein n=1 Tax=Acrobeloides nanus TaxID=290746 RepID=A0A914CKE2_9BILA